MFIIFGSFYTLQMLIFAVRRPVADRCGIVPRLPTRIQFMSYCGVVEARNLEDAFGTTCARQAASKCCDCGTTLCSGHAQRCAHCNFTFCTSCLSFHQAEHAKPAAAEKSPTRKRKSA
jgi:hypothetical protein